MLEPVELLAVARNLSQAPASDTRLRRAVSTAYYALFHHVLRAAASRFMGSSKERTAGYSLLYRSFDHLRMKTVGEQIAVSTLSNRIRRQLGRANVGPEVRQFANVFPALQEARHKADYDPSIDFLPFEVSSLISAAEFAMAAFDQIDPDERADILALMMVRAKG